MKSPDFSVLRRRLWHYWDDIVLGKEDIFIILCWETACIVYHILILIFIFCTINTQLYGLLGLILLNPVKEERPVIHKRMTTFCRHSVCFNTFFEPEDKVNILFLNVVGLLQSGLLEKEYTSIQALYVICHIYILVLGVQCKAKWWNIYFTIWYTVCVCALWNRSELLCSLLLICWLFETAGGDTNNNSSNILCWILS